MALRRTECRDCCFRLLRLNAALAGRRLVDRRGLRETGLRGLRAGAVGEAVSRRIHLGGKHQACHRLAGVARIAFGREGRRHAVFKRNGEGCAHVIETLSKDEASVFRTAAGTLQTGMRIWRKRRFLEFV